MRWRTGILGVLPALVCGAAAMAQAPAPTPTLTQFIRNGWLRFQVNAGRVVMEGSRFGNTSSSSSSGAGTEKLTLRLNNGERSVSYELSTPQEELSIEIASVDRLSIRRSGKQDSKIVPVQVTQVPDEPISLVVGRDPQQQVYRAATVWHLLIAQPDECRQHLIPLLEFLRPDWRLAETATAMETKLLQAASVGRLSDRQRWAALVAQLADERFSRREAADRELRSAGRVVLSYLRGLDLSRLDAEQQYRIRRIIRYLSRQTGDDTAEGFAPQLVEDPEVWLSLLSRQEEATRRLAARQLVAILEEPIRFDPAADAATRKSQIEQLRARIQGKQSRD
jgi:hypothetical protein